MHIGADTIVSTAEGAVMKVSGPVAKLIVAHPRLAVAVAAVLGLIVGMVVR